MLEAGRELDAEVAEKVMGWRQLYGPGWIDKEDRNVALVNYWTPSTSIKNAWQIVDMFDEVDLRKGPYGWLCRLERGDDNAIQMGEAFRATSAPLAICRAALDAVGSLSKC